MESVSSMISSEIFFVDENRMTSFFKERLCFGPFTFIFHPYSFKTVMQIGATISDLTASNLGIEKS